jgi:hypothetical protein
LHCTIFSKNKKFNIVANFLTVPDKSQSINKIFFIKGSHAVNFCQIGATFAAWP